MPDSEDRKAIFRMYLSGSRICFNGDLQELSRNSEGLSGGDIQEVCRRAVLQAAKCLIDNGQQEDCDVILSEDHLLTALDRWRLTSRKR